MVSGYADFIMRIRKELNLDPVRGQAVRSNSPSEPGRQGKD